MRQPLSSSPDEITRMQYVSAYVLAYLYWLASTVLGAYMLFELRSTLLALIIFFSMGRGVPNPAEVFYLNLKLHAADTWSIILFGVLLVFGIIWFENVFRGAALKGEAKGLFLKFAMQMCAAAAGASLLYLGLELTVNGFRWSSLNDPLLALLGAGFVAYHWQVDQRA